MNGQWIGTFQGSTKGEIIVEIDEVKNHYEGRAFLHVQGENLPSAVAYFSTPDKSLNFQVTAMCKPIHPKTSMPCEWDDISAQYPGAFFSPQVVVKGKQTKSGLSLAWHSQLNTHGKARLLPSKSASKSAYPAKNMSWDDFKEHVNNLTNHSFVFRGQRKPWRLRTNFHRTGRANLARFIAEDIPTLYRHLSTRTRHVYNLEVPDQNGAFYNLVQHHGYPTPLLDWSSSPYVAAFFAFRRVTGWDVSNAKEGDCIRIFKFNADLWRRDWNQVVRLDMPKPHFSIMEFMGIDNERMIPQQALSAVTNIDDIESYIQTRESESGKQYLDVIDIPITERPKVMKELELMGITAGALFPGLDGACEQLRERFFQA